MQRPELRVADNYRTVASVLVAKKSKKESPTCSVSQAACHRAADNTPMKRVLCVS